MGGWDNSSAKNDVWRSTNNGATWTQMTATAGWTPRYYHSTVAMPDGSIVLMGGWEGWIGPKNDVWRSTNNGVNWTQMTANAEWSARYWHSSVAMPDGSIVLMGGGGSPMSDVWRSTNNGATWTQMTASAEWLGKTAHTTVAMPDGSIVLMGGGGSPMNDVWRFQPVGSSEQSPSHTYTTPGIYQVAPQVYNAEGYNSTRKVGYITVMAPVVTNVTSKIGIFRQTNGIWSLDSNGSYVWDSLRQEPKLGFT